MPHAPLSRSASIVAIALLGGIPVGALIPAAARAQARSEDRALQFADGLYREGLYDMAAREYRKILDADPARRDASDVRLRLGDALLRLDRFEDAAAVLGTLLERDPRYAQLGEASYRLGRALLEIDRVDEAVRVLRRAERGLDDDDPLVSRCRYWLAESFFRSGQHAKALEALERILAKPLEEDLAVDARYTAAFAAYRSDRPARAVVHLRAFLEKADDTATIAECRFVLGECLYGLGEFEPAREAYESAAKTEGPYRDDALLAAAWCDAELGRHAAAARRFARVAELAESDRAPEARLRAGIESYRAERADDAERFLAGAAAVEATAPEASYWLGRIEKDRGDLEAAAARWTAMRPTDPDLAERVAVAAGEVLLRLERPADAIEAFGRVPDEATDAAKAYALHGASLALQALGRHAEAVAVAASGRDRFPETPYRSASILVEGQSRYELGDFEGAAERFRELLERNAEFDDADAALYKLGWCFRQLERAEPARQAFAALAKRYPKSEFAPEARQLAAEALAELGRPDEAIRELEGLARDERDLAPAASLEAARLRRERGEVAAAVDAYDVAARAARRGDDVAAFARARYEQAELLVAAGESQRAAAAYREAVDASATRPDTIALARAARYGLAWTLYDLAEPQRALEEARSLLADADAAADRDAAAGLEPAVRASTLHLIAASQQDLGRYDEARAAYERLLSEHPGSALDHAARFGLGICLARGGDPVAAAATLEKLLDDHAKAEGNDRVLYELAFAYTDAGEAAKSVRAFRRLVERHPSSPLAPEVHFRLGESSYADGDFRAASKLYDRTVAAGNGPYLDEALYKKGWADRKRGEADDAVACFLRIADDCEASELRGEALFVLAEMQGQSGDVEAAEASLRRLLREYPEHDLREAAHRELALTLYRAEAWENALRVLEEHRRLYPESERRFEVDFAIGRSLAALGRHPSAIQALRRVTAEHRGETAARAQFEIGECLRAREDFDGALAEYLKVRFLYAHDEWVAASLFRSAECFEKLGQPDRAAQAYAEVVRDHRETDWAKKARTALASARGAGS